MKYIVSALAVLGLLGGAAIIYTGMYNVAATSHHWAATYWVLKQARDRSIKVHASGIAEPANLYDEARIVAGTAHFDEDCSGCHAPPGGKAKDLAEGMYPAPPSLKSVTDRLTPGEIFWVLKNGIKMSGMPSWGDHSDDELWNIVAFTVKMKNMSADRYKQLVKAEKVAGGMKMQ